MDRYISTVVCGSCAQFSPEAGTWVTQEGVVQQWRGGHVSWAQPWGSLLLGGSWPAANTAEGVGEGEGELVFRMKYFTW